MKCRFCGHRLSKNYAELLEHIARTHPEHCGPCRTCKHGLPGQPTRTKPAGTHGLCTGKNWPAYGLLGLAGCRIPWKHDDDTDIIRAGCWEPLEVAPVNKINPCCYGGSDRLGCIFMVPHGTDAYCGNKEKCKGPVEPIIDERGEVAYCVTCRKILLIDEEGPGTKCNQACYDHRVETGGSKNPPIKTHGHDVAVRPIKFYNEHGYVSNWTGEIQFTVDSKKKPAKKKSTGKSVPVEAPLTDRILELVKKGVDNYRDLATALEMDKYSLKPSVRQLIKDERLRWKEHAFGRLEIPPDHLEIPSVKDEPCPDLGSPVCPCEDVRGCDEVQPMLVEAERQQEEWEKEHIGPCRSCRHLESYPADKDGHERGKCINQEATAKNRVIRGIDQVRTEGCYSPKRENLADEIIREMEAKGIVLVPRPASDCLICSHHTLKTAAGGAKLDEIGHYCDDWHMKHDIYTEPCARPGHREIKIPKPTIEKPKKKRRSPEPSICARCGDPATVRIKRDHFRKQYCDVCAYILQGFIVNSYSIPFEDVIGKHYYPVGRCGGCGVMVYAGALENGEEGYEVRDGIAYHHKCLELKPAAAQKKEMDAHGEWLQKLIHENDDHPGKVQCDRCSNYSNAGCSKRTNNVHPDTPRNCRTYRSKLMDHCPTTEQITYEKTSGGITVTVPMSELERLEAGGESKMAVEKPSEKKTVDVPVNRENPARPGDGQQSLQRYISQKSLFDFFARA